MDSLRSKPSTSEENGLSLLRATDKLILSVGISTGGVAEIRMVENDSERKVIATTIDEQGLAVSEQIINNLGLRDRIELKLEDLRGKWNYPADYFDFIYARLVLHYLPIGDLVSVLKNFYASLKPDGLLFIVVRSEKTIGNDSRESIYDPVTRFTSFKTIGTNGEIDYADGRYFQNIDSLGVHLEAAGFKIAYIKEYEEQLYTDFMRQNISMQRDHLIELLAHKH